MWESRGVANYRYKAFLSYSHADEKVARKLHRRLERYRVPRTLGTVAGRTGRLSPIFRDKEELASSGSLSRSIREALDASEYLVVVCSQNAADSRWVNEEVRQFVDAGREERVFCIVASGSPPAVFPAVLRERLETSEPLAADMRKEGDGADNAFLKIAAALLGVGFDELRNRDVAARQRRITAVAGASLAGMLLMTALALFAFQQQAEAERESAKAKQVSEFLMSLFEGADPYKRQVREPTLRELLDKGAERIETDLAGYPEVRATMQRLMGNVYRRIGAGESARTLLEESILGLRASDAPVSEIGEAVRALAVLDFVEGRYAEAKAGFLAAIPQLVGTATHRLAVRDMALALSELNDFDEALEYAGQTLTLTLEDPAHDVADVAIAYNTLAMIYKDTADYERALENFEKAYELRGHARPEDQALLASIMANYASVLGTIGENDRAIALLDESLEINQRILGDGHLSVAAIEINIGGMLSDQGRCEEALVRLARAQGILERSGNEAHLYAGLAAGNQAKCRLALDEPELATERAMRAREIFAAKIGPYHPNTLLLRMLEGEIRAAQGEFGAAEETLQQVHAAIVVALGAEHPMAADALCNSADVAQKRGALNNAIAYIDQCIEIRVKKFGQEHVAVSSAKQRRAEWLTP